MNLNRLLKPNGVAVVGASEKDGFGGDTCRNIMAFTKDTDKIYFVNPKRDMVFGKKCYKSLLDIEKNVDLVIICTPQSIVMSIMEQAAQKGCGGAVVFASGYKEVGIEGAKMQEELSNFCTDNEICLMGPNCAGFGNYIDDIFSFAFLTEERDRKGCIGMISQSGQVCLSALDSPGMAFSYIISSGNSANVKVEDYLEFLVDDSDTKVVAGYVEGIANVDTLVSAFEKAAKKRKPIVLIKTGKSAKASQLASSHTGSLSGSDKAFDAILEKYGVVRVNDLQELYGVANAFATLDIMPKGTRYAVMNVSGGEAGISADMAYVKGLELSELKQETLDRLDAKLPSFATANNPLDMTAVLAYDSEGTCECMKVLCDDENVDAIIMAYTITPEILDTTVHHLVRGIELAKIQKLPKPIYWLPFIEHTRNSESFTKLLKLGVPVLPSCSYGMEVLSKINQFVSYNINGKTFMFSVPKKFRGSNAVAFSEYDSMNLLKESGIEIGPQAVAKSIEEAINIANEMEYPLAAKIDSPDVLHKSDVGGVKLNIKSEKDLVNAYNSIMNNIRQKCPEARINGILLKPMLGSGVEVIVGVNNDEQFGPMIMIGLGGVFVEVFQDVKLYPAPVSHLEAIDMIKSLKGYKLLNGYRGGEVCDIKAFADFIVRVSEYAFKNINELKELDINPLFVYEAGKGVSMADALVIKNCSS